MHANGVAKVPYTDLDPVFAKVFGYDPAAAAQYAKEETIKEGQSDAIRNAVETRQAVAASTAPVSTTPMVRSGTAAKSPSPDVASIRARIAALQQDLAEKTAIMSREYASTTTHSGYNGNAYVDEIKTDQTQIAALQAQLAGH